MVCFKVCVLVLLLTWTLLWNVGCDAEVLAKANQEVEHPKAKERTVQQHKVERNNDQNVTSNLKSTHTKEIPQGHKKHVTPHVEGEQPMPQTKTHHHPKGSETSRTAPPSLHSPPKQQAVHKEDVAKQLKKQPQAPPAHQDQDHKRQQAQPTHTQEPSETRNKHDATPQGSQQSRQHEPEHDQKLVDVTPPPTPPQQTETKKETETTGGGEKVQIDEGHTIQTEVDPDRVASQEHAEPPVEQPGPPLFSSTAVEENMGVQADETTQASAPEKVDDHLEDKPAKSRGVTQTETNGHVVEPPGEIDVSGHDAEPVTKQEPDVDVAKDDGDQKSDDKVQEPAETETGEKNEGKQDQETTTNQTDIKPPEPQQKPPDSNVQPPSIDTDIPVGDVDTDRVPEPDPEPMATFEEWKQKMLAEQAEMEKEQEVHAQASSQTNGGGTKSKASKNWVNFASVTCGAKVLGANSEAINPSSLLTENRDHYMINPCKAKKWFTVELCEPVQIHTVELGNLELFSSTPDKFLVQITERYPSKEWTALGTFHARDERSIQSFTVPDNRMFVKHIKVEMQSHYGSEHYCPLSILRVFGTTMEDEDSEDAAETVTTDADEDEELNIDGELQGTDEPSNLFASAKDTVMSIVKQVLTPGENEENKDGIETGDFSAQVANQSESNGTSDLKQQTQPCPPDVTTGQGSPEGPAQGTAPQPSDQPCTPNVRIPDQSPGGTVEQPPTETGLPGPIPLDTTLKSGQEPSLSEILRKCNYCHTPSSNRSMFDMRTVCGYQRILKFAYPQCCVPASLGSRSSKSNHIEISNNVKNESKVIAPTETLQTSTTLGSGGSHSQEGEVSSAPAKLRSSVSVSTDLEGSITQPTPVTTTKVVKPTEPLTQKNTATSAHSAPTVHQTQDSIATDRQTQATLATSVQVDPTTVMLAEQKTQPPNSIKSSVPEPTQDAAQNATDTTTNGASLIGPDVVQIRPSEVGDQAEVSDDKKQEREEAQQADAVIADSKQKVAPPSGDQQQMKEPEDVIIPPVVAENKTANATNGLKDIYAEETTPGNERDLDLEGLPLPAGEELQYQKLTSGTKETTYMRLKNRIKDLELNLNLSSRYLDELSQRYRRKMDDLNSSINKTNARVVNVSKLSDERDEQHRAYVQRLESQLANLTVTVQKLRQSMDTAQMQMIEQHLLLMCVEGLVFIFTLAWCMRRYSNNTVLPPGTPDYIHHLEQKSNKPRVNHVNGVPKWPENSVPGVKIKPKPPDPGVKGYIKKHQRRNSIDATPPRIRAGSGPPHPGGMRRCQDDLDLRKSGSEPDLPIIAPCLPLESPPTQKDVPRKKKKVPTATLR